MYKYDLHVQTSSFAPKYHDAPDAGRVVEAYLEAGYTGIVLTNPWGYIPFKRDDYIFKSPEELADEFMSAYEELKEKAGKDLDVFLGAEVTFRHCVNEYLFFGLDREYLDEFDYLCIYALKSTPDIIKRMHQRGNVLIYQAHPFMPYSRVFEEIYQMRYSHIDRQEKIDGLELYIEHDADKANHFLARRWVDHYKTPVISGSGFSRTGDKVGGGIETEERIRDNSDLLRILRSEKYRLICGGVTEDVQI
ncbi:MAG: hypothetical protein J5933_06555 [Clostridia bacterium]|nr:hypothetical protein [Clostridia bacterium]